MRIKLKTITPIFIGAGPEEYLSPLMDYVRIKNQFGLVNREVLLRMLEELGIINDYVIKIKRSSDSFSLTEFLAEHGISQEDFSKLFSKKNFLRLKGIERNKNSAPQISSFISSAGRKYIPGSSIKGSIRTALAYAFLERINQSFSDIERKLGNKAKFAFQNSSLQFKVFSSKFSKSSKYDAKDDFLKVLRVRDSDSIPRSDFVVVPCYSYNIGQGERRVPVYLECFDEGKEVEIEINLFKGNSPIYERASNFWSFLRYEEERAIKTIFGFLNEFARDFINHEIERLRGGEVRGILNFYNDLRKKLDSLSEGEALMLIGRGTTFFGKTIDMLWGDDIEKLRGRFRERSLGIINGEKSNPFPITRLLWNDGGHWKPIGWAKLEAF
ncbi:MAG: type III-A CRISPR-associated RAMP protein Csm5 [Synergistetes bacterium]|nr:type III-A CRISPR-associated RAMP protein Csm5 [Synergistota bacterium]